MRVFVWISLLMSLFYVTSCSTSGAGNSAKNTAPVAKQASYDRDYASMLSGSCTTCHIQGAKNTSKIPAIHGTEKEILFEILKAFKYSEYESGTMEKIAKTFSDEELELMSYYFAEQK